MPKTGQAWVKSGLLAATIFIPPNTDTAIEMLVEALKGAQLPERKITQAVSIPSFSELGTLGGKARSAKV
jgi:hypothetical protein